MLDLQAAYSELFDRSRSLSLHLFGHVHGDSRERGQAMIDLAEQYMAAGCLLESQELPDFVPVFLEYASCLEPAAARETLGQPAHVFAALEERLAQRGSPYAAIFGALVLLGEGRLDVAALSEGALGRSRPDRRGVGGGAGDLHPHEMGGPTGMTARLRAVGKAMVAARRSGGSR